MHQDDINKDLGHYLHEKKKDAPLWKKVFGSEPRPKEEVENDIKEDIEMKAEHAEEQVAPEDKKELEDIEEHLEEAHEEEEVVEEKQQGLLKRFFKKLNFSKAEHEDEDEMSTGDDEGDESNPSVDPDSEEMRQFLKNMHGWITQLEPEKLHEFKNSKDFELYTKMLKKYNLIK